ncbi:MAG TPA: hypothetical protein VF941_13815, partial [Clostridia bacterium]
ITGWVDSIYYDDGIVHITFSEDIWEYIIQNRDIFALVSDKEMQGSKIDDSNNLFQFTLCLSELSIITRLLNSPKKN